MQLGWFNVGSPQIDEQKTSSIEIPETLNDYVVTEVERNLLVYEKT